VSATKFEKSEVGGIPSSQVVGRFVIKPSVKVRRRTMGEDIIVRKL
jgi:hypothetical protein